MRPCDRAACAGSALSTSASTDAKMEEMKLTVMLRRLLGTCTVRATARATWMGWAIKNISSQVPFSHPGQATYSYAALLLYAAMLL